MRLQLMHVHVISDHDLSAPPRPRSAGALERPALGHPALSIYTTCGATGFSMGLVLSGLLTEVGWRWTMLLPAPLALVALAAGLRLIPKSPRERPAGAGYDLPGALTGTAAMLLLVFT